MFRISEYEFFCRILDYLQSVAPFYCFFKNNFYKKEQRMVSNFMTLTTRSSYPIFILQISMTTMTAVWWIQIIQSTLAPTPREVKEELKDKMT